MLDRVFHAMEVGKGGVALDHLVGKDPRKPRVHGSIDQLRLTDGAQQAFGSGRVGQGIGFAEVKILLQAVLFLPGGFEAVLEMTEYAHD